MLARGLISTYSIHIYLLKCPFSNFTDIYLLRDHSSAGAVNTPALEGQVHVVSSFTGALFPDLSLWLDFLLFQHLISCVSTFDRTWLWNLTCHPCIHKSISFSDNGLIPVCFLMTITANELSGKAEDFTDQEPITRVMGLLTGAREYEVRERIPPPYNNSFQCATLAGYF